VPFGWTVSSSSVDNGEVVPLAVGVALCWCDDILVVRGTGPLFFQIFRWASIKLRQTMS